MPFKLSVEVDGQHELDVALSRAADTLDDLTKYWPQVADVFYDIEREQFATEGARGGIPWAALSPAYAAAKKGWFARENPFADDDKILRRTGALRRSLTSRDLATESRSFPGEFSGGAGIYIPERESLTLGSSLPYALAHQRGNPATNLPARPPIALKAEDAGRMRRAFKDQVAKEVRRIGWPDVDLSDYRSDLATVTDEIDEDMSMF